MKFSIHVDESFIKETQKDEIFVISQIGRVINHLPQY